MSGISLIQKSCWKELLIDDPNHGPTEDIEIKNNDCGCLTYDMGKVWV